MRSRAGSAVAAFWQAPTDRLRIPVEIRDAVEQWARPWGRHGDVVWNTMLECAVIELALRDDDPRMKAWRDGKLRHKPKECIPLNYQPLKPGGKGVEPYFVPLSIDELGVSGVLEILNKGNTWSGTGEWKDFRAAVQAAGEYNDKLKAQIKDAAVENARLRGREHARTVTPKSFVPDHIKG